MTLASAPSGISENQEAIKLSPEAEWRVQIAAKEAMRIIENNPELEKTIRDNLKNSILDAILKNPMMVQKVLNEVDRRFKEGLEKMPASERLKAIKWYAELTAQLGHDIAEKTLNIPLDNALNGAKALLDAKTESLRDTYKALELSLKNEINSGK